MQSISPDIQDLLGIIRPAPTNLVTRSIGLQPKYAWSMFMVQLVVCPTSKLPFGLCIIIFCEHIFLNTFHIIRGVFDGTVTRLFLDCFF
jgi:hypothetical protein